MTALIASGATMVFFSGLWAGGILIFAVERVNLWRRMPLEQFAVDFRRSLFRVDPMMPILGVISGVAAIYYALHVTAAVELLAWIGIALLAIVIVASVSLAEPINSKFRRLPEGKLPEGAEQYRITWRKFHLFRTVVALASFAALSSSLVMRS